MNLAVWAQRNGVARVTAYRWFRSGSLPIPARKVGRLILVDDPVAEVREVGRTAVYARVSSADQKTDLHRQVARVTAWATGEEMPVDKVVTEVGSALNGHRRKFLALLRDPTITRIVVEHRDRFCRFGSEYVQAALAAHGRELVVVDSSEVDDDLVRDNDRYPDLDVRSPVRKASGSKQGQARDRGHRGHAGGVMAQTYKVPEGWVLQAYQYALDPAAAQIAMLESHAGGARFAYNTMLRVVKANLSQREAERSYGVADADLTPTLSWSFQSLRNDFNRRKHQVAVRDDGTPWWGENSKEAYANAVKNLSLALKNWNDSRKGARKGPRVGFPSFKSKRSTRSFTFTTGTMKVEADRHHVTLPRLGTLRVHESTRKLARRLQAGTARILKATVRFERGRWLVSFTCVVERVVKRPAHVKRLALAAGVDLGVKDLIVVATPDGDEVMRVRAPKEFKRASRKLRALQRKAARQSGPWDMGTKTRQEPSHGWIRTQQIIATQHVRVANLRRDRLHKLTTELAQSFDVIGTETLAVKNMMRSARGTVENPGRNVRQKAGLNRSIADAGLGEFSRQLDYKTTWYGSTRVQVGRWYPSSKTCSGCGSVKAKLSLCQRLYVCDNEDCGLSIDRDLNAAINLARLAWAEQSACFDNSGADRKTTAPAAQVAVKPESSNGSASPQGEAA